MEWLKIDKRRRDIKVTEANYYVFYVFIYVFNLLIISFFVKRLYLLGVNIEFKFFKCYGYVGIKVVNIGVNKFLNLKKVLNFIYKIKKGLMVGME